MQQDIKPQPTRIAVELSGAGVERIVLVAKNATELRECYKTLDRCADQVVALDRAAREPQS